MDSPESEQTLDKNEEEKTEVYDVTQALTRPADNVLAKFHITMMDKMEALQKRLTVDAEKQYVDRFTKLHNPNKRGREEMPVRWDIPIIRVLQGMTRERPPEGRVGNLYTSSLQVIPQPLRFTPLYVHETNRMFVQGSGGEDMTSCRAPDARMGTSYGWCDKCVHLPRFKNATGKTTPCDNGLIFTILTEDLRLFILEFFKTARSAGVKLDEAMGNSVEPWDNWYELKSDKLTYESREWFVLKADPMYKETPVYIRETATILYDIVVAKRKMFLKGHYESISQQNETFKKVEESPTHTADVIPIEDPTAIL